MGLNLDGYDKYVDPTLTLTVRARDGVERTYVIPEPSAELGLWCQTVASVYGQITESSTPDQVKAAVASLNNMPELETGLTVAQRVMGSAFDAMLADGVSHPRIEHCASTVFAWIVRGEKAAIRAWRMGGGSGEAPGPGNRAERRAAEKTGGRSTVAADATPKAASTSDMRSPRKSSRSRKRKSAA
ncbi:DUF7426 family protein [Polymorphospora rubra]|uniref:DUF7426 domain-containing protein n=1 Tax=Polymorphospora rubra TaxID=338584 RepID=A0A810MT74_9ACTN|nr:hypothetical protein [Polymorphospora rubra]BCJ64152.1 hypothetical protein Prubr_11730 [Polymorphospora rubra]